MFNCINSVLYQVINIVKHNAKILPDMIQAELALLTRLTTAFNPAV